MNLTWDVARAGGLVAWGLATASVMWGLVLSTRLMRKRPWPAWFLDLHRLLGGLAVIFTVIHVAAIYLDTYTHFGLTGVFIPFATMWHPVAVAWGIVAFYLLLAVEVTSLVRNRIGRKWWRRIHLGSFGLFAFATIHAVSAGTDTTSTLILGAIVLATLPVAALAAVRLGARNSTVAVKPRPMPARPDARVPAPTG
ncbi:MAG TPA: ferric reductase-like transmembrane domain-containing protein [Actinomycetota bacterium]|jgi:DMSO/TMAO reductase YedYZ heme-binding membrane subunit|nr:ferric reductase-like transmembrane domain-containing protein [Actinomycetota bacterium]